ARAVNIDPDHLAMQSREVLAVADQRSMTHTGIIRPASITKRKVEIPVIGAEKECSPVMVLVRFIHLKQDRFGRHIHLVWIKSRDPELREVVGATPSRVRSRSKRGTVISKHPAIRGIIRVKCYREEPPLIIRGFNPDHPIPDINEWLLENGPIHEEDLYIPVLIDEEQPAAPIMRICNLHGGRKPAGHELQADRDIGSMQFC